MLAKLAPVLEPFRLFIAELLATSAPLKLIAPPLSAIVSAFATRYALELFSTSIFGTPLAFNFPAPVKLSVATLILPPETSTSGRTTVFISIEILESILNSPPL